MKILACILLCVFLSGCATTNTMSGQDTCKQIYLRAYQDGVLTQSQTARCCEFFDKYPLQEAMNKSTDLIKAEGKWDAWYVWGQSQMQTAKANIRAQQQAQQRAFFSGIAGGLNGAMQGFNTNPQPQTQKSYIYNANDPAGRYSRNAVVVEEDKK